MDLNELFIKSINKSTPDSSVHTREEASENYHKRFSGIGRLIGKDPYLELKQTHVMIIGVGGVGSWAAESLVRSGIGKITLVDLDDICITNTNRQLPALENNVGQEKVSVLKDRLLQINPEACLETVVDFFTESTADEILSVSPDFIIDAIDGISHKCLLISECLKRDISLIVCGAAGGRIDPTQIRVSDLMYSKKDKMLKSLRKKLKYTYNIDTTTESGVFAVYSEEFPTYPTSDGNVCAKPEIKTYGLDCKGGMGSASFVTGSFGFTAASIVLKQISMKNKN